MLRPMFALFMWVVNLFRGPPMKYSRTHDPWVLEELVSLSDAYAGILVSGTTGSGKSSGPMKEATLNLMSMSAGMLVLTAKTDEPEVIAAYAAKAGRTQDLRVFKHGEAFNFLKFEYEQGGLSSCCGLMDDMVEATVAMSGHKEIFWVQGGKTHIRHAVCVVAMGAECLDVSSVVEFMNNLPSSIAERQSNDWKGRYASQCLLAAIDRGHANDIDFMRAFTYVMDYWPRLDEKIRSGYLAEALTTLNHFMGSEVSGLVNGCTTLTPQDILEGRIVVIGTPILSHREAGRAINLAWKLSTQRHVLRRAITPDSRVVAFVTDEAPWFAVASTDAMFQAVCRSSHAVSLMAIQNRPLLQKALGGDSASTDVNGWLANFQNIVLCQNACMDTNKWASGLIGEATQLQFSGKAGDFDAGAYMLGMPQKSGMGFSETLRPILRPEYFATLRRGGYPHCTVEAVVYAGGRKFSNGKHFITAEFDQRR